MVAYDCGSSLREAGELRVQDQPGLYTKTDIQAFFILPELCLCFPRYDLIDDRDKGGS